MKTLTILQIIQVSWSIGIPIIFTFFSLLILLMVALYRKADVHFKLVKELFPNKLLKINSYLAFMLPWNYFADKEVLEWFWFPLRREKRGKIREKDKLILELIKKRNKQLVFLIFAYIIFMSLIWIYSTMHL